MVWETKTCSHKRGGRIKRNIQIRKWRAFLRTIGVRAGGEGGSPPPSFGNCGNFSGKRLMIQATARGRKLKQHTNKVKPSNDCRSEKVRLNAHMPTSVEWSYVVSIKCPQLVILLVNERCWKTCRLHSFIHQPFRRSSRAGICQISWYVCDYVITRIHENKAIFSLPWNNTNCCRPTTQN